MRDLSGMLVMTHVSHLTMASGHWSNFLVLVSSALLQDKFTGGRQPHTTSQTLGVDSESFICDSSFQAYPGKIKVLSGKSRQA